MSNNVKPPKGGNPPPPAAAPAPADGRPRAQVAYEGDDEFSVMSTKSGKRKPTVELKPATPGQGAPLGSEDNEGEGKNKAWHFIRKIFGQ